jgi:hypothetical protein
MTVFSTVTTVGIAVSMSTVGKAKCGVTMNTPILRDWLKPPVGIEHPMAASHLLH